MRNVWTRNELLMALNLYCKVPYGQFNVSCKEIQRFGKLIGRSPGAVAFKLVNFVSLDPKQQLLGRKGATNTGKLDRIVFKEFMENFDECLLESERLLERLTGEISSLTTETKHTLPDVETIVDENKQGTTRQRVTMSRVNQDYFRKIVLSNYAGQCAVTGITIPDILVASHIKPWKDDENNRLNPANGLCLSATLDKAFDRGLITIDSDYHIVFSQKLKTYESEDFYGKELGRFENQQIILPVKFLPNPEFLKFHYDNVFIG